MNEPNTWRKCTTCKKPISFGQKYWICSVSTCNRVRTDLVFCDLRCFDAHVPVLNHRDAGAFERKAPPQASEPTPGPTSKQPSTNRPPGPLASSPADASEAEILEVVSKVKKYIKDQSGMNTSDAVMDLLSDRVRSLADQGIKTATVNGRKTVMERDF